MTLGHIQLPKMTGTEVRPGVRLLAEPVPVNGTNKFTCLAEVSGALCLVELKLTMVVENGLPQ